MFVVLQPDGVLSLLTHCVPVRAKWSHTTSSPALWLPSRPAPPAEQEPHRPLSFLWWPERHLVLPQGLVSPSSLLECEFGDAGP